MVGMPGPRTYADRRAYVLPASWDELGGPASGEVELPASLRWTGRRLYDLAVPADVRVFYERVIVEALDADDLADLLNADRLGAVWADLYLPARARRAWEQRFPILVQRAAG